MACCEAVEHVLYLFFFAKGILISEEVCGEIVFSHCITDCKGLFDHLHREGTPKAPSQEGLAIGLAGLRQILMREALQQFKKEHGANVDPTPDLPCRPPIHWAPTALQMADILTIERNPADWAIIERVKLLLPRRSKRDQYRVSMHRIGHVFDLAFSHFILWSGQYLGPRASSAVRKGSCHAKLCACFDLGVATPLTVG